MTSLIWNMRHMYNYTYSIRKNCSKCINYCTVFSSIPSHCSCVTFQHLNFKKSTTRLFMQKHAFSCPICSHLKRKIGVLKGRVSRDWGFHIFKWLLLGVLTKCPRSHYRVCLVNNYADTFFANIFEKTKNLPFHMGPRWSFFIYKSVEKLMTLSL